MAGWQLLEMASGQLWCAPTKTLSFGPRVTPTAFVGVFITNEAWGQFSQTANSTFTAGTASLAVNYQAQTLTSIVLAFAAEKATASLDGAAVTFSMSSPSTDTVALTFSPSLTISTGSTLTIVLSE